MSALVFGLAAVVLLAAFFFAVEFFGPRGPGSPPTSIDPRSDMAARRRQVSAHGSSPVLPAQRWRGESRGYVVSYPGC